MSLDETLLDLGRSLYKLHFQLLLLIEASNKMLATLTCTAKNLSLTLQDISSEITSMKSALSRALEESTESERGTPTPTPSPSPLPGAGAIEDMTRVAELLKSARWSSALEAVRLHRAQWPGDPYHDDDDVTTAVNMYCRYLGQERAGNKISLLQTMHSHFKKKVFTLNILSESIKKILSSIFVYQWR